MCHRATMSDTSEVFSLARRRLTRHRGPGLSRRQLSRTFGRIGTIKICRTLFVLPIRARGCRFLRVHVGLIRVERVLASLAHLILRSLRVDGSRRRGRRVRAAIRVVKPWDDPPHIR